MLLAAPPLVLLALRGSMQPVEAAVAVGAVRRRGSPHLPLGGVAAARLLRRHCLRQSIVSLVSSPSAGRPRGVALGHAVTGEQPDGAMVRRPIL
jgi:hypothetical protein